ncbi:uncharacterized protein LOC121624761 [Chelmon rostratus]|uniref:uncharacterized protein LOC121624761 n=1 Tax=Chelmon rostratus TaxID=109905 RepID=UPI001BE97270|nr:uncharacterized protein LOC121624761 [Chelmon rostratus]
MRAHWWSCVLGLLCMPAEVILNTSTVSQDPSAISLVRVNSSTEITCSTSFPDPMGFYLHRGFHENRDVVFLDLENGQVNKISTAAEFVGRVRIASNWQTGKGDGFNYGFILQLSLLRSEDTDWYYCSWIYFKPETADLEKLSSIGTAIIVRDYQEQCKTHIGDLIFIALSVTAFTIVLFLFIGALIVRRRRFKKRFRPARPVNPRRPNRPQHVSPQERPYLITSASTLDFRGIL